MKYLFATILLMSSWAYAGPKCGPLLTAAGALPSFTTYMQMLIDNRIIGERELRRLLEAGRIINPILEEDALVNSDLQVHREGLERILRHSEVSQAEALEWAERNLLEKKNVRVKRDETKAVTQTTFRKMVFHRIYPNGQETTMGKFIEMMETPVTQSHWATVMLENPAQYKEGVYSAIVTINGKSIPMQPDNPIESVSYHAISAFIMDLHQLIKTNDPRISDLVPDHQPGDLYRLPYGYEFDHVAMSGHRVIESKTKDFDQFRKKMEKHAWFFKGSTAPVAELLPFVVDGNPFYDILGNVMHMTRDQRDRGHMRVGISHTDMNPLFTRNSDLEDHIPVSDSGFRLVRERKP